ncbi:MAG: chitinase [Janthinobacterium lividum]
MKKTILSTLVLGMLSSTSLLAHAEPAFSPYVDVTLWDKGAPEEISYHFDQAAIRHGIQQLNLAFVVAKNPDNTCQASWGGYYGIDEKDEEAVKISRAIKFYREKGGEVLISLGGANGTPLADAKGCQDPAKLRAAYENVLNTFGVSRIDFDLEGQAQTNKPALDRRFKILAELQQAREASGKPIQISLTLPVLPSGLTDDGVAVVDAAVAHGVKISLVNVMAMDYGAQSLAGRSMSVAATDAATALQRQLGEVYQKHGQTLSSQQLWKMVGITPMLGVNDVSDEIFSTKDAQALLDFAKSKDIGLMSMWSLTRDQRCAGGAKTAADPYCSSVDAPNYAFSKIFMKLKSHWGKGFTADPSYVPPDGHGAEWTPDLSYEAGATVTYKGSTYRAKYWTKGDTPGEGEWGPWEKIDGGHASDAGDAHHSDAADTGHGDSGTDSSVVPDRGGDAGKGEAGSADDSNHDASGSDATQGADTSSPVVPNAPWSASQVYNAQDAVTYNGHQYIAQWWTRGDVPGASAVWALQGGGQHEWAAQAAYSEGTVVNYKGHGYRANWWSQGVSPDAGSPEWTLTK